MASKKKKRVKGEPTDLNLWVCARIFGDETKVSNQIEATSVPHMRRCMKAGLVTADRTHLKLTAKGVAAMKKYARKNPGTRKNPSGEDHWQKALIWRQRAHDEQKLGMKADAKTSWALARSEADNAATAFIDAGDRTRARAAQRLKATAEEKLEELGGYPKMLPRKNSGHDPDAILEGAARAIFVDNWASLEDEAGHSYPGQDLMDVAPETSEEAERAAKDLLKQIAKRNNVRTVWQLFRRAMDADGIVASEQSDEDARDFGHYLAMESMGHGVSWFDDHADFPLKLPHVEYWPADIVPDWEEED